ncbi:MAG: hypothetical protein JXO72_16705, partial [Vicinamibacteria bacterium]|nr:hypothetical protein [Vicinamibacteria bacterium]
VKTFVIAFGSGAQINRANWIAWGGSGLGQGQTGMPDVTVEDAGGDAARWADSYNNTSLLNLRNQCPNCLDAFGASSADELKDALQAAIDLGAGVGLWSASNSVWSSIFEYGASLGPFPTGHECEGRTMDPMEADDACTQRYRAFAWRQYKPSFEMPGYQGQVRANDENGFLWDAGQKLLDRMHDDLKGATTGRTFAQIKVNMIPRRIFTTNMNGIINAIASEVSSDFPTPGGGTSMTPVNLWTPDAGPDSGVMGGSLDAELGITDDLAYLQSEFGACVAVTGFDWGSHNCNSNVNQKLTAAKAEARQILLAFTAGVTPILSDGAPMRDASSREILYRARPWMLTESTLAAPGLVTQPSPMLPPTSFFETEYRYYMDRLPANANGVQKGFGLRNPDKGALVGSDSLKPVMSVVYVPGNDGLHAFRAGPCPASVAMCAGETGGEELWNFVPYDQLPKLKELRKTQSRDNHTYMMANNVEFSSVFVPGDYNATIDGQPIEGHGVWRTLLLAGRGAGGKHVSTLDITSRGPFTLAALDTNLPDVLWNRGNPDTRDGTTGGTDVRGDPHKTAYSKMGQTWSTPIVGRLPEGYSALYAAFMGSGYGDNAIEGKTFYVLNVLNGDVIHAIDDPESKPGYFQNVFLATPSIYQPSSLTSATTSPEAAVVTRVYFGDLQGRVWKFLTRDPGAGLILCTDLGIDHPIGVWSALMSIGDFAHIYVSTGHDVRVTPSPVFKAVVLKDNATDDLDVTVNNSTPLFTQEFPAPGVGKGHFRGSVDPQAVYWLDNNEAKPGVAIAANRYNPMTDQCRSSFDSIVYLFLSERSNDFDDVNVPAPAYREGEYITGLNIPTFVEDPDVVADDADTSTPDESGGSGGTGSIGVKAKKEPEGGTAAVHTRSVKNGSAVCRE